MMAGAWAFANRAATSLRTLSSSPVLVVISFGLSLMLSLNSSNPLTLMAGVHSGLSARKNLINPAMRIRSLPGLYLRDRVA